MRTFPIPVVLLCLGASAAISALACNATIETKASAVPVVQTPAVADAGVPVAVALPAPSAAPTAPSADPAPAGAVPPQFASCTTNADCVAVAKVGCCHDGTMVAVAQASADAYAHSFVCGEARPICPQHILQETRVPRCSPSLQKCEMVGKSVYVK